MGALYGAVELGALGRQDEEGETVVGASLLELNAELGDVVDLLRAALAKQGQQPPSDEVLVQIAKAA